MGITTKYQDENDEFLHPLWLGILILFTVMIVIGIVCCLRKKFGLQCLHLFTRLCCRNEINKEDHSKTNKNLSITSPYQWAPVYIPTSNSSPKLYKVVRNFPMISVDRISSDKYTSGNEDEIENDVPSIEESDQVKTSLPLSNPGQELNKNRNAETARRFFASMRQTSQCQNSQSIDSANDEPVLPAIKPLNKSIRRDKPTSFRTSHFFQSITN